VIEPQDKKKQTVIKYGLIDKEEVNSKYHANQEIEEQKLPEKQTIVNLYVRKKMEERAGNKDEAR
jgi:hypothetical protein